MAAPTGKKAEEPVEEVVEPTDVVEAPPAPPSSVLPTRIETFSVGGKWGYRTVDNTGTVAYASEAAYTDAEGALKAARDARGTDHLALPDVNGPSRFAWR